MTSNVKEIINAFRPHRSCYYHNTEYTYLLYNVLIFFIFISVLPKQWRAIVCGRRRRSWWSWKKRTCYTVLRVNCVDPIPTLEWHRQSTVVQFVNSRALKVEKIIRKEEKKKKMESIFTFTIYRCYLSQKNVVHENRKVEIIFARYSRHSVGIGSLENFLTTVTK